MMTIADLIVGADDFATGTQKCEGWTYFILPKSERVDFETDARAVLAKTGMSSFHGKEYRIRLSAEYRKFLKVIRDYLLSSRHSLAVNTLITQREIRKLKSFARRVARRSLNTAGVTATSIVSAIQKYIIPMFTLFRLTEVLGSNLTMQVELDKDSGYADLASMTWSNGPRSVPAAVIFKTMLNAYRTKQFPSAPSLADNPLDVMDDEKSMIVQAADVLGNFSMAYMFVKLGKTTKTRVSKADLFDQIFGDTLEDFDFLKNMTLHNDDIILNVDGYINFRIYHATEGNH